MWTAQIVTATGFVKAVLQATTTTAAPAGVTFVTFNPVTFQAAFPARQDPAGMWYYNLAFHEAPQ